MLRKLQLFMMIFCLGIFVFPKQNFNAQVAQSSCCESQTQNSDCCKKEDASSKACSHDSKKEKDCKDNCTTCKTCSSGFVFSVVLNNFDNKLRTPIFEILQIHFRNSICLIRKICENINSKIYLKNLN